MATQRIHLNGGPWHDRVTAVPFGRNHFHIIEPVDIDSTLFRDEGVDPNAVIRTREGMYSQVRGTPGEFEWDGWRSHD